MEYEPGAIPAKDDILSGLETFRLVHVEDGDTIAFASRYDARFSAMRKSGAWTQPHPWVEALLPGGNTEEILRDILELYPVSLGDGPRLFFVDRRSSPPFLRMPDDPVIACCALLPVAIPPHILSDTLDAFRAIHARILRHGGKRILSGWITMMDDAALRDHYGDQWPDWVAAKRVMDPAGILD
ncbi:MAG TPA: hypothetical protein VJT73_03355, partial [Polyangiaceae bacterium]|nr:hypothetical protein [Polyangiaceae bacterium]